MIQQMEECGPQLSPERIRHIESLMGIALPIEHKEFLLRHNGGRPTPNAYPIEGLVNNPYGVIQVFFGIGHRIESCNLDWNYEVFKGRVPSNLLPIAYDGCGDLVCLSLFGDDEGAVLFWDYHTEPPEPSYANVYKIAASFSEFIDGIWEYPDDPSVI